MPLRLYTEEENDTVWAIWEATEPEDYFSGRMELFPEEQTELGKLNDRKRYEWLVSRNLLHQLSGRIDRGACLKDGHGKPYLQDSSHEISISHSRDMVAVMASPVSCGIDIQYRVDKIYRIADKFTNPEERSLCDNARDPVLALHIIWGAKEALYKAYGRKKLEFRTQIIVDAFDPDSRSGNTTGSVIAPDFSGSYAIRFRILNDLVLVYAVQI